jgi:uncharacterized MAPEG superfamily protein
MPPNILTPAAVLVVWTLVMFAWMAATRGPALGKLGPDKLKPGARGQDLEGLLDYRVNWKAHNYTHLHEQPTVFYAAVLILVLAGYSLADVLLAWAYVAVRIVHSVWQATVNRQPARAILFLASSLILIGLGVRALLATLA